MGQLYTDLNDFLTGYTSDSYTASLNLVNGLEWHLTAENTGMGDITLIAEAGDPFAAMTEADAELLNAGFKRATIWRPGEPYTALIV